MITEYVLMVFQVVLMDSGDVLGGPLGSPGGLW